MLTATVSNPAKAWNKLKLIPNPSPNAFLVLRMFFDYAISQEIKSSEVVVAWRDTNVFWMKDGTVSFEEHCRIDAIFEDYIKAIYDNPAFCEEVIAQKNMDIRNGENIDTGWRD